MDTNANMIRLDYSNMMRQFIGDKGILDCELEEIMPEFIAAARSMEEKRPAMEWRELPYTDEAIINDIIQTAEYIRARFENFVILGIGGSALGPLALHQALCHLRYNELPPERRRGPRIYVEDNIDPERMHSLFDVIDPVNTCFNVISKSGNTAETMSQFMLIADILYDCMGGLMDNVIVTTGEKGTLFDIADKEEMKAFYIPEGVGGRFSVLSPVGLLTAAVSGIDIRTLLKGAAAMDKRISESEKNIAYIDGALQYLAMKKGVNISVMMPYADSLKYISDWYAQLWGESLGKRYTLTGEEVFCGQTPVKAVGTTDQHSQLQLYTEGPHDKVITFIAVDEYRTQIPIPKVYADKPDISFLGGHSFNDLIKYEQFATAAALKDAGRMNKTIILPKINAFTVGQLLYMLEVETAFVGELLRVNAFDQPGVEAGKKATLALMGKPGYEEQKQQLEAQLKHRSKYII